MAAVLKQLVKASSAQNVLCAAVDEPNGWMDRWMTERMDGLMDWWMDWWMDCMWVNGRMDGWVGGWMEKGMGTPCPPHLCVVRM
eukprot:365666-Chlamydomonas_euryale.AAC.4